MGLYKKIVSYALIGATSLGIIGCDIEREEARQKSSQPQSAQLSELKKSPYSFESTTLSFDHEPTLRPSSAISVTCGDLDGDGDLEIIVATQRAIIIHENKTEQKE